MSARPSESSPWPVQTPSPPSPRSKWKRLPKQPREYPVMHARQLTDSDQIAQAQQACEFTSGNSVISCFPTSDTIIPQHQYAGLVWNSNLPQFTQTKAVNIYLRHADSFEIVDQWLGVPNPPDQAGTFTFQVNDTWWPGSLGSQWSGTNVSRTYQWIVIRSDHTLDGSEIPQTAFTAVQTTFADSIVASMASTASVASASSAAAASRSSASAASASSASAASASSASGSSSGSGSQSSPTKSGNGSLQPGNNSAAFPHWAIAVIVVLGFLAIVACGILIFFIMRRVRRQNQINSNRGSMGSASPMMANVNSEQSPQSPLLGGAGLAGAGVAVAERGRPTSIGQRPPSVDSTVSRAHSAAEGPFSGADAAIMATAFREALRKPDFAGQPVEEGESPEAQPKEQDVLNRELAEEGRDIRSVSSSRGVRVETLSDDGDTVQDH